jgi:hypothetical protein
MGDIVNLAERKPFASGGRQLVFEHPLNPSLAIKVLQPHVIPGQRVKLWSALAARYYFAISFKRVWREFERWRRKGKESSSRFLQRVAGVVETDLGPGLVVEAERDINGGYAPTLRALATRGEIEGDVRAAFNRFCSELEASDVVLSDLNPGNIVYAVDPLGGSRFVLIDGTGDDTFIPVLRMSKTLNRMTKARKIAGLRRRIDRLGSGAHSSRDR